MKKTIFLVHILSVINKRFVKLASVIGMLALMMSANLTHAGGSGPARVFSKVAGRGASAPARTTTSLNSAITRGTPIPSNTLGKSFNARTLTANSKAAGKTATTTTKHSVPKVDSAASSRGVTGSIGRKQFSKASNNAEAKKIQIRAKTAKTGYEIAGYDTAKTMEHLKGINLQKPVIIGRVNPGHKFRQL